MVEEQDGDGHQGLGAATLAALQHPVSKETLPVRAKTSLRLLALGDSLWDRVKVRKTGPVAILRRQLN